VSIISASILLITDLGKSILPQNILLKLTIFIVFQFSYSTQANAEIRVGITTPLSGPLQVLGKNATAGIEAYFHRVNANGGIQGQKLRLIVEDDGYEPRLAAPNMRKLIEQDQVIAVIGNVGTPTAIVTLPIAVEKGVPFVGAITGAPLLRKTPPNRYIFNYRASYSEEVTNMIDGLLSAGIKPEEIALFTQRDAYGDAGYEGAITALNNRGFMDTHFLGHGRYTRNSLNVEGALATILDSPTTPRAIIMAGGYAPSAKFIKLAKEDLPNCLFLNLSFVGGIALMNELGNETKNVIITQVVPNFKSSLPIVEELRKDLKQYLPDIEPGFISLETYIVAKIFVEALRSISGEIHRESLVESLDKLSDLDIGLGLNISYSKYQHQAIHKVWPMMIKNQQFISVDWEKLDINLTPQSQIITKNK
jgi:ABC-type branched-subunit amino acid transport system substrate-binding protein